MFKETIEGLCEIDDDFAQFWKGYTQCLGFCATVEDEDGSSDSLFSTPGGQNFDDHINVWPTIVGTLTESDRQELLQDAYGFYQQVRDKIALRIEVDLKERGWESCGTDFHFSRNGHGAGFFDGDWEQGTELQNLAKTWGTLELTGDRKGNLYLNR